MKTFQARSKQKGFTLIELLVAMAITAIIVGVLVSITGIAIDTWNRSRQELRTARQAKAMLDLMANDFESLVIRSGGTAEWLAAVSEVPDERSANAAKIVFFTAATDRYDGQIGVAGKDNGGDVSSVGYVLEWKDPIKKSEPAAGPAGVEYQNFVFSRLLLDPKPTFEKLLGQTGPAVKLEQLFIDTNKDEFIDTDSALVKNKYFVCENISQFTVTFHVETLSALGQIDNKLISIQAGAPGKQQFRIKGSGLQTTEKPEDEDPILAGGRVTAVEISVTVLTDTGVILLRNDSALADDGQWMSKNGYHYSKLIQLPRM